MPDTASEFDAAASARRVLALEAEALGALGDALPTDLPAVVDLFLGLTGRVIVCGIGKSGHVGRKISATLASTGTPSYFVHAGEASHGDLGMIAPGDACLMLSNSGETAELADVIAYCARFDIPVIGLSSRPDSTLMRAASLRLTLPPTKEACPIGMAPTTSTTLMMALGDAIAVALMTARGFETRHFRDFHPGGKLGAQMMRVSDLMHGPDALPLVDPDTRMTETMLVMSAKGFGIAAVVAEDGRLFGVVTDGDLRRHMEHLSSRTAGQIATRHPVTVTPDELAAGALARLNERKISVLLVVDDDGHPQGVLHIHDCLRAGVA
ncbi:KpsF/GutQ family sugar-phosphate isomerase [Roseivivax sediminis]|uniref:Arabinose-5-phosphate isomerase n=1 Tax=Roseivivax sediminis TaxID=936889 RepID=A0A1I2ADA2_9RHOB|nr:KpsF/GutQ family sugar-phosphate isomerase [Roseivivax sediminis]SFE41984.1 arabinose-5-phosphate isomerase [Roseivivax sediminis]